MNKFAIGCLITLAVLVVGGGTAGYFLVIKPAGEFFGGVMEFAKEMETLNQQVDEKGTFTPPENATLGSEQLDRFLAAQGSMKARLSEQLAELDAKYKELNAAMESEGRDMNLSEIASAYQDMGRLIIEAKQAQVAALNQQDFSLSEYAWVRDQVYGALGASVSVATLTDSGMVAGGFKNVHPDTITKVTPHREELMETYVLAWFGL